MRSDFAAIEQAGPSEEQGPSADRNNAQCLGRCTVYPIGDANAFLLGRTFSYNHDRVALKLGVKVRQTMMCQQV